jgi:hypothetical protein
MNELTTDSLARLAAIANKTANKARAHAADAFANAKASGEALNKAKALCASGEWTEWLADNFEYSDRTARRFMRIASAAPDVIGDSTTIRQALIAITESEHTSYVENCVQPPDTVSGECPADDVPVSRAAVKAELVEEDEPVSDGPSADPVPVRPAKSKSKQVAPAAVFVDQIEAMFAKQQRLLSAAADANGGKGPVYKESQAVMNLLITVLKRMRKGEQ